MAFGQEIRFKIAGDTSRLQASFSKAVSVAEQSGRKMEAAISKIDKIRSGRGLLEFRRKVAFEEADTTGKIKITTEKLASLSYQISKSEQGTTRQKNLQLQMDKERTKLALLRKQKVEENIAQSTSQQPAEDDGGKGGGKSNFRQLAFRALGTAITFALERVINYNASRVRVTDARGESNALGLASLRSTFASIGGLQGQLRQGKDSIKDLESQRNYEQNRRGFLTGSAFQNTLSFLSPEELEKSDRAIAEINTKIQQTHNENQLIERDLKRQTAIRDALLGRQGGGVGDDGKTLFIGAPGGSLRETREAQQSGNLSAARAAQIELGRLRKVAAAEKANGTPESARDAEAAVFAQETAVQGARQNLQNQLLETNRDLAGQAGEGRTFANGRARPRSETERLAQRAAKFRERSRGAVLTGASEDAARFLQLGIDDESTVANRLSAASSGVKKLDTSDATAIKPELVRANQLLGSIDNSLKSVDVDN